MSQLEYKTTAYGNSFAVASPFYLSSFYGLTDYLSSKNINQSALATFISLTINMPHLCGLGGDCLILNSQGSGLIKCFNGSGRTGSGHNIENIKNMGFDDVQIRGWTSAMIYGGANALHKFSESYNVDINFVIRLLESDIYKNLINTKNWNYFYNQYLNDITTSKINKKWLNFFEGKKSKSHFPGASILHDIATNGFMCLYDGTSGLRISEFCELNSSGLIKKNDVINFNPPNSLKYSIKIFNSEITMVANNTPWLEFSALLKVIEFIVNLSVDNNIYTHICRAAGAIDCAIDSINERRGNYTTQPQMDSIVDFVKNKAIENIYADKLLPILNKGSDTVFMAVAGGDGVVVGLTGSIFTPFGSLLDPDDTGIILSNRAASFNITENSWKSLKPNELAPHTTNVLIVENNETKFAIGTTGGPVQVQVLAQLIYRILYLKQSPQNALEAPRCANMGFSKKHGKVMCLAESKLKLPEDEFNKIDDLSVKMGVAQIAGICKITGQCYGATDPRGDGVALAI